MRVKRSRKEKDKEEMQIKHLSTSQSARCCSQHKLLSTKEKAKVKEENTKKMIEILSTKKKKVSEKKTHKDKSIKSIKGINFIVLNQVT